MNSPCFGCEDRVLECHVTCERYRAYDESRQAMRDEKRHRTEYKEAKDACYWANKVTQANRARKFCRNAREGEKNR